MADRTSRPPLQLSWAVGTTEMPACVDDSVRPPFRPVLAAVVNGHGLVIGHGVSTPDDPDSGVEQALQQAIAAPANGFGSGCHPRLITVTQVALGPVVERLLPGIPIRVGRSAALEELFSILPAMGADEEPQGILGVDSLLSSDLRPQDVGSFFEACQGLYERQPWTRFADDQCLFQVTSQALGLHRWCGCVIGQAGESYGVLLFQSRQDQRQFIDAAEVANAIGEPPPGLFPHQWAINFEPLDAISRLLADEIAQHGWPVAAGDGYPVPLHVDPDLLHVPLTRADLARLEAVARALSRLIDNVPQLDSYWHWTGQDPLRRQAMVPVQDRGQVSVSLTLLPPEEDDDEQDWHDVM